MSSKKPYIIQDKYFQEAKKLWYRARSAFKLIEIQEKFKLIKPHYNVLDVASAPGSFLQAIRKIINKESILVGIDLQKIDKLPNENTYLLQEDINNTDKIIEFLNTIWVKQFDIITSDIAPATTGQTWVDQYRSIELNLMIIKLADTFLKKWHTLVLKVFVWEDIDDLVSVIKQKYKKLNRFKPRACRDRSFEEYFICSDKID